MFCYYQERTTRPNDYTRENDEIIICNYLDKVCPYKKLKKAQKRCQWLTIIEEVKEEDKDD